MARCWFCDRTVSFDYLIAGYDTFEESRLACLDCDRCLKGPGLTKWRTVEAERARHDGYREGRAVTWVELQDYATERRSHAEYILGRPLVTEPPTDPPEPDWRMPESPDDVPHTTPRVYRLSGDPR